MPVQLIIEDGSGVAGANAYGLDTSDPSTTLAAVQQFATNRGVDLTTLTDDQLSVLLINATDFLESLRYFYVGKVNPQSPQTLSWPRINVWIYCNQLFPSNQLPPDLLNAEYQLCIEQFNGVDLLPTDSRGASGGFVTEEKVDVILTKYSEKIATTLDVLMPKVDSFLASITQNRSGLLGLTADRG